MVNEVEKRGVTVYVCELCRSAYGDPETAERCEHYCYSHGHSSHDMTQRAVKPLVRLVKLELRRRAIVSDRERQQCGKQ